MLFFYISLCALTNMKSTINCTASLTGISSTATNDDEKKFHLRKISIRASDSKVEAQLFRQKVHPHKLFHS